MANFNLFSPKLARYEGGYENYPNDSANFVNGVDIGTNHGISAQAYYHFYGVIPTVDDIKSITIDQANQIFKTNYWDKINGDRIQNQSVAELMMDFVEGSGYDQISVLKKIANDNGAFPSITENDNPITDDEADRINKINQELYFDALKTERIQFFNYLAQKNPVKYGEFLQGWLNRINKYVFVSDVKKK